VIFFSESAFFSPEHSRKMSIFAHPNFGYKRKCTMQELKELTEDILEKSSQLVRRYADSVQETISLKSKNKELRNKVELLEAKVKEQSDQIVRLQFSKVWEDGEEKRGMKLKLNELVREIDHCLQLLEE
jgi:hypothetical protein